MWLLHVFPVIYLCIWISLYCCSNTFVQISFGITMLIMDANATINSDIPNAGNANVNLFGNIDLATVGGAGIGIGVGDAITLPSLLIGLDMPHGSGCFGIPCMGRLTTCMEELHGMGGLPVAGIGGANF
jgi:hypothetical protein